MPAPALVSCGMYAFTDELKDAWRNLFSSLHEQLSTLAEPVALTWNADDETYRNLDLLIGHTCGYPYLKKWAHTHIPVCVPLFDVDGCTGPLYSSWFITYPGSGVENIASAQGKRAAISGTGSNSGMNVLRSAVADAGGKGSFFSEVSVSGGHGNSVQMVAEQQVELAAIDAVSYFHVINENPRLSERIRVIGQSGKTTGLPFIQHRSSTFNRAEITDALNSCLGRLDLVHRQALKITAFHPVTDDDYGSISQMETNAVAAGYPTLD